MGNIAILLALHDKIEFKQRDTRLALSYHVDDNPSIDEMLNDIRAVERVAFAGFEQENYLSVWVNHRQEKNKKLRTDVHGVFLRQDLTTGLSYNPYYDRVDRPLFDLLKRILNRVRGYEEPSAPERSRVFGFTLKGNPIHEFAFKVKEICANKTISSREELADELDRQGYKVKRKSTGRPCGRKSLTLVAKDGQQITLVGSPIEPIKAPKLVSKEEYLEQTVEAELRELNRLCRARAQRNWNIYRKKRTQQTEEQARETGYGFSPITLNELIPINETERKQRRTGLFAGKKLKGNTGVEQATTGTLGSTAPSHSEAGAEKREFGQFPSESVSGFDENQRINRRPASDFRSIGLKESIGQASGAIKERIKKFVKKAKQDIKDLGGPPTQSH